MVLVCEGPRDGDKSPVDELDTILEPMENDIFKPVSCPLFILWLLTLNSSLTAERRRCLTWQLGTALKPTNKSNQTSTEMFHGVRRSW